MEEVDMELAVYKEDSKNVKCKMCLKYLNKYNKTEVLIQCGTCNGYGKLAFLHFFSLLFTFFSF